VFIHQNHGTGGGNGSIMVGMFVCLCLASQNPFERECFVPAGTDLGVKVFGMVQAYVGQKLLKRDILRVFTMSDL